MFRNDSDIAKGASKSPDGHRSGPSFVWEKKINSNSEQFSAYNRKDNLAIERAFRDSCNNNVNAFLVRLPSDACRTVDLSRMVEMDKYGKQSDIRRRRAVGNESDNLTTNKDYAVVVDLSSDDDDDDDVDDFCFDGTMIFSNKVSPDPKSQRISEIISSTTTTTAIGYGAGKIFPPPTRTTTLSQILGPKNNIKSVLFTTFGVDVEWLLEFVSFGTEVTIIDNYGKNQATPGCVRLFCHRCCS